MIIIETSLGEIVIGLVGGYHHDNSKRLSILHFHMEYNKARVVSSSSSTFVTIDFEENIHDQREMNTQNILQEEIKSPEMFKVFLKILYINLKN
jgi:hypothetical protein